MRRFDVLALCVLAAVSTLRALDAAEESPWPPRVDKVVTITKHGTWELNTGERHANCSADQGGPWGDPRSVDGKAPLPIPSRLEHMCWASADFVNDTGAPAEIAPPVRMSDKQILKDTTADFRFEILAPQAKAELRAEIAKIRGMYEPGAVITEPAVVPPYSRGTVHWTGSVVAERHEVRCLRYRARRPKLTAGLRSFGLEVTRAWTGGPMHSRPIDGAMAAATADWGAGEDRWDHLGLGSVGEIWAIRASRSHARLEPLECITEPVVFEHWADVAPPPTGGPDPSEASCRWKLRIATQRRGRLTRPASAGSSNSRRRDRYLACVSWICPGDGPTRPNRGNGSHLRIERGPSSDSPCLWMSPYASLAS